MKGYEMEWKGMKWIERELKGMKGYLYKFADFSF